MFVASLAALFLWQDAPTESVASAERRGIQRATSDAAAIAARSTAFSTAYVAEDVEELIDIYSEDGVAMPGPYRPVVGRNALRRFWTVREGVDIIAHESESEDLRIMGDIAIDRGIYRGVSRRGGKDTSFAGRYLIVWERSEDGLWRMTEDMWAGAD